MLKNVLSKFFRGNQTGNDIEFSVSGISLRLPAGHDLPKFKSKFPLYDTFLGHIVKSVADGELVIDVGANVGDTLAIMAVENSKLSYLCIEADDYFYNYLTKNIVTLTTALPSLEVKQVKCLVAKDVKASGLSVGERTKKIIEAKTSENHLASKTLSDIYKSEFSGRKIGLIKIDVDGYDYDVVNSAIDIIAESNCYVYFECDAHNEENLNGYISAIENLSAVGYENFVIFDNYGSPMITSGRAETVIEVINYTLKQNSSAFTRTFFYIDVLAYNNTKHAEVKEILRTYIK